MSASKVKTFYVIDLDRTTFDTVKSAHVMVQAVKRTDTDLARELEKEVDATEKREETFSTQAFLEDRVDQTALARIREDFLQLAAKEDLLLPGSRELFEFVRGRKDSGYGILTFGSVNGQTVKLMAAGLMELPHMITDDVVKGKLLSSWQQPDGTFLLPETFGGVKAERLVFIDDKPVAFQHIPSGVRCYWVHSIVREGIDQLPLEVIAAQSLDEIIKAEQSLIDKA